MYMCVNKITLLIVIIFKLDSYSDIPNWPIFWEQIFFCCSKRYANWARSRLRKLGINNNRILDTNYPDRNIGGLLVHNDYVEKLEDQLNRFYIQIKKNSNTCNGTNLKDLQRTDHSKQVRDNIIFMHHCNHMERELSYIRIPSKYAVARYFYERSWISKGVLSQIFSTRPNEQTDIFINDDNMNIASE